MKFFEEINLSDFKSSKTEKEALKEKLFELRFCKLSYEDLDKISEEIELMKDGAVSIFSCIIFLKKMIDVETKEKFQRIVKREGMDLFRARNPDDYNRKKRPYSAQGKIDEIKKNEDMNIYNKYENLNKNIEGAKK